VDLLASEVCGALYCRPSSLKLALTEAETLTILDLEVPDPGGGMDSSQSIELTELM